MKVHKSLRWMLPALLVFGVAATAITLVGRQPAAPSDDPQLVAMARIKTLPNGSQATSGVSYVQSDTVGSPARLRQQPNQDSPEIDQLLERFPVTMKCWASTKPPVTGGSAKWFLVTQADGAPRVGLTGWVWSDLVWEQIAVPGCNGTSKASNPDFLRSARLVLAQGAATADGYNIDITVDGVPAGWRIDLKCLGMVYGQPGIIGSVRLAADSAGRVRSTTGCSGGASQQGLSYSVEMPWPRVGRTEAAGLKSEIVLKLPAGPPPTISGWTVAATGPGKAQVAFNVGWGPGLDPVTCTIRIDYEVVFTGPCGASVLKVFTGLTPGDRVFTADVRDRNNVPGAWSPHTVRNIPGDPRPTQQPPPTTQAPPPTPKPTIANFTVVVYTAEPGHVGVSYDVGWQTDRDPVTCHFFVDGQEVFTAQCGTHSSKQFYGINAGQHSFHATVSDRFGVYSDPSPTIVRTVPGQAPPPTPSASLAKGPAAPSGFRYAITLNNFAPNAAITITCHDSVDPQGFYTFTLNTNGSGYAFTQSYCYSGDHPDHWFKANGVESNHVQW